MNRFEQIISIIVLLFGIVVLRLGYLQVVQGAHYRSLSENNRVRFVPEEAPRGLVFDRNGKILISNQMLFQAAIVPQESEDLDDLLRQVGMLLGEDFETLRRRFRRNRSYSFVPAAVSGYLEKDKALVLEEERWRLPGLTVDPVVARRYPFRDEAAHVLGYLGKPRPEEIEALRALKVRPNSTLGRTGIERLLDRELRGHAGDSLIEVNHRGHKQRVMHHNPAVPGRSVTLTIDIALQSLIRAVFQDQPGAAVVLDPRTGAILALVSTPSFDPEAFAVSDSARIREYLSDESYPLLNRATLGTFPPGSIAKLIIGAAALEEKIITRHTKINCTGSITIGDRTIHCWYRDGHGYLDLIEALRYSCNVYFMRIGRWLGLERLRSVYERMGFGQDTGWILGEQKGTVPEHRVTQGEIAMLSIGQGPILVTPLQMAMVAGLFASEGWVVKPWIISEVGGKPWGPSPSRYRVGWSREIFHAIRDGMAEAVRDPEGTGHRAYTEEITIAGKTGTAQAHRPETHGWFAGFCPVEDPVVAFAVLAEFGGSGGDLPAKIGRAVCEYVSAMKK